ncbi:MAG: hypothetical protein RLZ04_608 [Actinomycetota bacterium]
MSHDAADFLLTAAERVAAEYPDLFRHQCSGVAFLLSRKRAILADDMGLGKTRTSIVAAREQCPDGPFLVICPASLKRNWEREIRLVEPNATIAVVDGEVPADAPRWTVVNYDRLGRHKESLVALGSRVVIVDEAHYVRNKSARSTHTLALTEADGVEAVYMLTGTPMTNRPRDLFNLLKIAHHPVANSWFRFTQRYCGAYDNGFGLVTDGATNIEELAELIAGKMLRRAKADVLDLPEKVRTWFPLELPTKRVNGLEDRALDFLSRNEARSGPTWITFLSLLNKARHQLAVAKATPTADFVTDLVEAGQKVVVFTGYKAVVEVMRERFGDRAVLLTGDTPLDARQVAVDRFQADPSIRVFIGNLTAAGTGITLTSGDHVVFNDLDWVPANHWQAEDRIHRIGRTATAYVTYMYTPDTLDAFVAQLLEQKAALVAKVEANAAAQAGMIDAVVDLVLQGHQPTMPSMTTEPERATVGLLADVLALWEQLGPLAERSGQQVFTFPSSRDASVVYETVVEDGVAHCDCPGFAYGGNCKHAKEAMRMAREANRSASAAH